MADNWDSYICEVEGRPASILVDLEASLYAPLPEHPQLVYASLGLLDPGEFGFPGASEHETLARIEEALAKELCAGNAAVYVGSCVSGGRADFFFYADSARIQEKLERVAALFPAYVFESGSRPDPGWSVYSDFLFPGAQDLLLIQNRRGCEALLELGDDLSLARRIEHLADFHDSLQAVAFAEALRASGYAVDEIFSPPDAAYELEPAPENRERPRTAPGRIIVPDAEPGASASRIFRIRFSRPDLPDNIDELVFFLADLARGHGGVYHGWACPPAAPATDAEPGPAHGSRQM